MVLILAGGSSIPAEDQSKVSTESMATLLDLEVIEVVFQVREEWVQDLEYSDGWVTLRSFSKALPKVYRDRLPVKDGWGEDYLFAHFETGEFVLSKGENRAQDFRMSGEEPEIDESSVDARKMLDPGDDMVLAVGGEIMNAPLTREARLKQTVADMRSIGTAVESFAIDENRYPEQSEDLLQLDRILDTLQPLYIRVLPLKDAWGDPFLYWSDGREYILLSTGGDGVIDRYYRLGPLGEDNGFSGAVAEEGTDIVFANGQFFQWPENVYK